MINEHEVMQQAHARADEIIKMAQEKAQATVDKAMNEANAARAAAAQYMDEGMGYLENIIFRATQSASTHYESLIGELNKYGETVKNDRKQLHPEEYGLDEVSGHSADQQ